MVCPGLYGDKFQYLIGKVKPVWNENGEDLRFYRFQYLIGKVKQENDNKEIRIYLCFNTS